MLALALLVLAGSAPAVHREAAPLPFVKGLVADGEPGFVLLVRKDGPPLEWWTDFEKTCASFAETSPRDAKRLREWRDRFLPIAEKILLPEAQSPPLPKARRRALLEASPLGRTLLETSALSPLEFVVREFEPAVIALERAYHGRNAASALKLGQARGAIMVIGARHTLPVFEYAPARVKRVRSRGSRSRPRRRRFPCRWLSSYCRMVGWCCPSGQGVSK